MWVLFFNTWEAKYLFLTVDAKNHSYDILIENHIDIGKKLKEIADKHKVFVVTDDNVYKYHGEFLEKSFKDADVSYEIIVLPHGEKTKSLKSAEFLYDKMIDENISRKDYVAAFGGGVIGDLAGFVASTILRGVKFIQIPTTLLSQVDSSVGGKVAVNTKGGKNLVGSFYPPVAVIIDTSTLKTLPEQEFACGMAEVIKYGAIYDKDFFDFLYENDAKKNIEKVIHRCLEIKRDVVNKDEFDTGLRMILNFGHTYGHIVESYYNLEKFNHGQAIAIGMERITKISEKMNLTKKGTLKALEDIFKKYNLHFENIEIPKDDGEKILYHDKKSETDFINYIILKQIGKCDVYKLSKKENFLWKC